MAGNISGGEPLGDSSFYQQITVPAGGGTLSFWHWDFTTDSITFDWQDAYITDSSGTILTTIFHQCLGGNTWIQQNVDMTPYAGQTVRIKFLVHQDGFGDDTGMYVDDVTLGGGTCGTPSATPTFTATATPTATGSCTPGGTPGPWTASAPYPTTDVRYGFVQTATDGYVFGGVSDGTRVNAVNRVNFATGAWQSRAPMPFASEAPTCALMASTGIVYCAEGDTGTGFASYNIATDTWASLTNIPGTDHYGSASGAFNGKVFVAGGSTGFVNTVQVYDVATNTWSSGTIAPNDFLLAGYQQVGQYLYVVGGFEAAGPNRATAAAGSSVLSGGQSEAPDANNATTLRLDMSSAPGVWSTGPAFTPGRADFALSYDAGTDKLYAMGGDANGGGFFDSTNLVNELSVSSWPAGSWAASTPNLPAPNRQANQAGFYGAGQIWSVGGLDGASFVFSADVERRSNGGGGCSSPSATPTSRLRRPPRQRIATATATATNTQHQLPHRRLRRRGRRLPHQRLLHCIRDTIGTV